MAKEEMKNYIIGIFNKILVNEKLFETSKIIYLNLKTVERIFVGAGRDVASYGGSYISIYYKDSEIGRVDFSIKRIKGNYKFLFETDVFDFPNLDGVYNAFKEIEEYILEKEPSEIRQIKNDAYEFFKEYSSDNLEIFLKEIEILKTGSRK